MSYDDWEDPMRYFGNAYRESRHRRGDLTDTLLAMFPNWNEWQAAMWALAEIEGVE